MSQLSKADFARAVAFIAAHGRLLERRLFALHFEDGTREDVVSALNAYRNPDGGLGHALEPDMRTSTSQPLFAHFGLSALREAGCTTWDGSVALGNFLERHAAPTGAIAYALPNAFDQPAANHWPTPFGLERSLIATAGVVGGLRALGAPHDWVEHATGWCIEQIEGEPDYSGHTLLNVMDLIETLPDATQRDALWSRATGRLFEGDHVQLDTPITTYGLTPLHFAPNPDARARALFDDDVIEAHLDDLIARQQDDGGWPIFWTPPPGAAASAWRARWTLDALLALRAHGRLN